MKTLMLTLFAGFLLAIPAAAQWPCPTCITDNECLACHVRENVGQACLSEDGTHNICWNCCTACPYYEQLVRMSPAEKRALTVEAAERAKRFYRDPLTSMGHIITTMMHADTMRTSSMPHKMRVQMIHERISPRVGFIFAHREAPKVAKGQAVLLDLSAGRIDLNEAERRYR